jgi:hypothetical protein
MADNAHNNTKPATETSYPRSEFTHIYVYNYLKMRSTRQRGQRYGPLSYDYAAESTQTVESKPGGGRK